MDATLSNYILLLGNHNVLWRGYQTHLRNIFTKVATHVEMMHYDNVIDREYMFEEVVGVSTVHSKNKSNEIIMDIFHKKPLFCKMVFKHSYICAGDLWPNMQHL